jgi:hypothetical protein
MLLRLRFRRRPAAVTHVCRECESRRAQLRERGIVKWDRYQALCFQCCRRLVSRYRASTAAADVPLPALPPSDDRAAVA